MHIASVLSYLGAWEKLQKDYTTEFNEIRDVLAELSMVQLELGDDTKQPPGPRYSARDFGQAIARGLRRRDWCNPTLQFGNDRQRRTSSVDAAKGGIGLECVLGKYAFAESDLFVKFPLFIRAQKFQIALVILPMRSLAQTMVSGVGSFEFVSSRISELYPLALKYPFAIIGVSQEVVEPEVSELSSELDQYLLSRLGRTLDEIRLLGEISPCDFKVGLPENRKLSKAVCAMANLAGGGVILIGVDNAGNLRGIPRIDADATQLTINNVVHDSCSPCPGLVFHVFDAASDAERCIVVAEIAEMHPKPCMASNVVYIRVGTQARPAQPHEVRRLILGGEAVN
jgi:hypothetical protein